MKYLFLIFVFVISCVGEEKKSHNKVFTMAFGSCNKQYKEQPLWNAISKKQPDVWIWLGDVIYADTDNMEIMKEKYQQQLAKESYQAFCKEVPIIGIWDDHDYGVNNGGKEFIAKAGSQKLFLDFIDEPQDSARRQQQGIYWAHDYEYNGLKIKVLLLDTRYHRELPGKKADVLGEQQWMWLQNELQTSEADFHIVCSSIQVLSRKHRYEKWANFPQSRHRLLTLLKRYRGVILLSGDRHFSEISRTDGNDERFIYEVTSSGMTHNASLPITMLRKENVEYRVSDCFNKNNFGAIVIDAQQKVLKLQICDKDSNAVLEQEIAFSALGVSDAK